jgi:hypothetical protein
MPEDTVVTSSAKMGETVRGMATQALGEIIAAVVIEQMNEHPKLGASLLLGGGLTLTAVGGWRLWKLMK